jgi:hypothetical protein
MIGLLFIGLLIDGLILGYEAAVAMYKFLTLIHLCTALNL